MRILQNVFNLAKSPIRNSRQAPRARFVRKMRTSTRSWFGRATSRNQSPSFTTDVYFNGSRQQPKRNMTQSWEDLSFGRQKWSFRSSKCCRLCYWKQHSLQNKLLYGSMPHLQNSAFLSSDSSDAENEDFEQSFKQFPMVPPQRGFPPTETPQMPPQVQQMPNGNMMGFMQDPNFMQQMMLFMQQMQLQAQHPMQQNGAFNPNPAFPGYGMQPMQGIQQLPQPPPAYSASQTPAPQRSKPKPGNGKPRTSKKPKKPPVLPGLPTSHLSKNNQYSGPRKEINSTQQFSGSTAEYPAPSNPSTKRKKSKLKDETVETVTKSTKPEVPLNPFRNFDTAEPPTVQKERNIVIIGETGVGKSTWINGIANYIKFDSFDDSLNGKKPICVIPMEFNVYTGEKLEKSTVSMKAQTLESGKNEAKASTGQSCTQAPKVYRFVTDTVAFNLIDTPGIGDTRGLECDMENMRMIMKCVSKWDKIHGICLLLKPNVSRLTLSLRYCIVELLTNLHRNAIPNVSVVFTNSCNTLYKPGDTMTVLRKLFEDVKNENQNEIPLTSANTFCLDNEPVRMLYAHHKGVQFEKACINNFLKSWNHTVKETYRLFDSVTDLDPHLANETKVVSIVRALTHELCTILADFDERIRQEQKALDQQVNQHKILEQKLADTKKEVFQGTYLEETPISQPNTVCCGPNCVETIRDPTTSALKTFHKRVCFQSCSVQNVPVNQIGATNLRQCPIFDQVGNCSVCGCSWQSHMHISYSQTKRVGEVKADKKKEDDQVTQQILSKFLYITQSQQELKVLRESYQKAQQLAKPFFAFLQENLIVSVNSAFEEYAEFSIEQLEQTLKTGSDRYEIDKLKKLLAIHQQQKFLASEKPSEQEKITFANYSLRILELENKLIVDIGLTKSSIYKKLFDFPELDIVEVAAKTNLIVQYKK